MKPVSPAWHRFVVVVAFIAVAVAAFEAGVLWRAASGARPSPGVPAEAVGATNRTESPASSAGGSGTPAPPVVSSGIRAEFNPQSALLIGANELVKYHQDVFKELVRAAHAKLPVVGFVNDIVEQRYR